MKETTIITSVRYFKKSGEYVVTTMSSITGKRSKTYANSLTDNERAFAKSSKHYFEDETCACWVN